MFDLNFHLTFKLFFSFPFLTNFLMTNWELSHLFIRRTGVLEFNSGPFLRERYTCEPSFSSRHIHKSPRIHTNSIYPNRWCWITSSIRPCQPVSWEMLRTIRGRICLRLVSFASGVPPHTFQTLKPGMFSAERLLPLFLRADYWIENKILVVSSMIQSEVYIE